MANPVSFGAALRVWFRIGWLSFGGPAGQIALMHRELVEERRWISEARFMHALQYCMLLPGPEATQLATYIGWLMHRTRGGVAAGLLFVLPGYLTLLALSVAYTLLRAQPLVSGLLFGLKAAVLAIVFEALLRVGKRALVRRELAVLSVLAFLSMFALDVPYPLVVLAAGAWGALLLRPNPPQLEPRGDDTSEAAIIDQLAMRGELRHTEPSLAYTLRALLSCLALWAAPVLLAFALLGPDHVLVTLAVLFSKAAVVTFGGAYSVLAYIGHEAVATYGWLEPREMLDGLGFAETTPGPLIMVLEYVGFLAGMRHTGLGLHPLVAGTLGATLSVWVTFVPCFLWILVGAPYIEALRNVSRLSNALAAITAAVVGVIASLAAWLTLHTLFAHVDVVQAGPARVEVPVFASLDVPALVLACVAAGALFRFRLGTGRTLALCTALGAAWRLVA